MGKEEMMRKVIVGFLSAALILLCASFVGAFQNEPEGFRGLKWGDPPTGNMKYVGTITLQKVYEIPGDKMSIGNAEFYDISYCFYDGRFSNVVLYFNGEENYDLLETICKGKFGEEMKRGFYELVWYGQTSTVILQYDMVKEKGFLSIASTQIIKEWVKAKEEKEIEEAEGDW